MQLFINTLNNQTHTINADSNMTVQKLQEQLNCSPNASLFFAGRILMPINNLSTYGITNNSTITLSARCCGGALTETDRAALLERMNKTICRICYATNSVRATNCRKKNRCGRSSKLRMKKNKKSSKKSG
ncbi:hypothetical protein COBT_001182 [Conglomerata obtusa]